MRRIGGPTELNYDQTELRDKQVRSVVEIRVQITIIYVVLDL